MIEESDVQFTKVFKGGYHGVRAKHKPTGISVECVVHVAEEKNRAGALRKIEKQLAQRGSKKTGVRDQVEVSP